MTRGPNPPHSAADATTADGELPPAPRGAPDEPSRAAAEAAPELVVGTALGGRYRVDALIGSGGMGAVYRGRDTRLERAVAIKVMRTASEVMRERFLREARAAAALNHPHIVAIHDVDEHDGLPFLVMELVEGSSLRSTDALDLDAALELVVQVCAALDHAHARGLVHRDIKPDNILVTERRGARTALLADLGLAVGGDDARLTREGGIAGTAAYIAPEQALGRRVDGRADLYALGVVLYELATGELPFTGEDALTVISQHIHAPLVPPRSRRADIAPELEAIIVRLLQKEPDRRFASGSELAEALDAIEQARAGGDAPATAHRIDALARGRLVGRDDELGRLRAVWDRPEGHPPGALLAGEPGAGKSRLAAALADYVGVSGAAVLSGGCYELEAGTPYLPFVEALRRWVRDATDDELRTAIGDGVVDLARLAPEIAERLGDAPAPAPLSPNEERLRLFDHYARFLERVGRRRGVLLLIDDLQWADAATLQLVHYLLRQPSTTRHLFLLTYRDAELDRGHATAQTIRDWERQRLLARHAVERLSRDATAELLRALLGQSDVAAELVSGIHAETEGNPFFVEEIVKTLVDDGHLVREGASWRRMESGELVLPPSVMAAIERRLDRVSPECRSALRMAAVLGKDFEFDLLVRALDGGEDAALDAIEEAEAAQLVTPRGADAFVFTHDKIREVLHESVNPVRRRRLHRSAIGALESLREAGRSVPMDELAHHAIESADNERGMRYARDAAVEARAVFATDDAERLLLSALGCAEAMDASADVAALEFELASVLIGDGRFPKAIRHLRRALELERDPAQEVLVLVQLGRAHAALGEPESLEIADRILALPPERLTAKAEASAHIFRGRLAHNRGMPRDAIPELELALDAAERTDDPELRAVCMSFLAGAYQHICEIDKSNAWVERTREVGTRAGDQHTLALADEFRAENAFVLGDFRNVIEFTDRELATARAIRSSERTAWALGVAAEGHAGLGDLSAAERVSREALEVAERIGERRVASLIRAAFAEIRAERGALDAGLAMAEAEIAGADESGLTFMRLRARSAAAMIHLFAGRPEAALPHVEGWHAVLAPTQERAPILAQAPYLGLVLACAGQADAALETIAEAEPLAARQGSVHVQGMCHFVRAHALAREGHRDDAERALATAVERFEANGSGRALGWIGRFPISDIEVQ